MLDVKLVNDISDTGFDCVVAVNDSLTHFGEHLKLIESTLLHYKEYHPKLESTITLIPFDKHPSKKLIFSPIQSLDGDYDDSRRISEASNAGMKRACELGMRKPLLVFGDLVTLPTDRPQWASREYVEINMMLGAFFAAYVVCAFAEPRMN